MSFFKRKRPNSSVEDRALEEGSDSELVHETKRLKSSSHSSGVSLLVPDDHASLINEGIQSDLSSSLLRNDHNVSIFSVDTDPSSDFRTIRQRNVDIGKKIISGELQSGIFRGRMVNTLLTKDFKPSSSVGPVRGQQYSKASSRIDYQPDICKDYKETGYCGWGDTCVFLHDRSQYKSSWQIDREFEAHQRKLNDEKAEKFNRRLLGGHLSSDVECAGPDSSVQCTSFEAYTPSTSCSLCNRKWMLEMKPVITRCRHYFCSDCVRSKVSKGDFCTVCQTRTLDVFEPAKDVLYTNHDD